MRAPDRRLENALSVGAKTVRPLLELLSWALIWSLTAVLFISLISTVNCPAFSRTLVMLSGPGGAGAAAGWAETELHWSRKKATRRENRTLFSIFLVSSREGME